MKRKSISLILALLLIIGTAPFSTAEARNTPKANPTSATLLINNKVAELNAYYIYDPYNDSSGKYFKLRDLAYVLSDTEKQFDVEWDSAKNTIVFTSGSPYTVVGSEMKGIITESTTSEPANSKVYLDGKELKLRAYTINGNNYVKLYDIGQIIDFCIILDNINDVFVIDTSKNYADSYEIVKNSVNETSYFLYFQERVKVVLMSSAIIKSFADKDKEALGNLFCEQVRNSPGFDEEIDRAFEFLDCDVYVTATIVTECSAGGSTTHAFFVAPKIPYVSVLTEVGSNPVQSENEYEPNYYSIDYYWQMKYEDDESFEGLHYLVIELLNADKLIIGEKTSITKFDPGA